MTNREIWVLAGDFAAVFAAGTWLGYRFRKIVERIKHKRDAVNLNLQWREAYPKVSAYVNQISEHRLSYDRATPPARPCARRVETIPLARPDPVGAGPFLIPLQMTSRSPRGRIPTPAPVPTNPDHADVVAALVGAGYKRAAAVAAVDACTLPERSAGVEAWVAAALRRASAK